jgi:hypothetical protein
MPNTIVMWGAPQSGKTTYLLSLVFWEERREGSEKERRLCVLPSDRDTANWIARMAKLNASGSPLPKTSSVQKLNFSLYDLPPVRPGWMSRNTAPSRHIADLTFWDAPGEYFEGPIPDELLPEIVRADGLILIVNPLSPPTSHGYWNFFDGALTSLKKGMVAAGDAPGLNKKLGKISYPVAICLSQVDRAPDPERKAQEWLSELLGADESFLNGWLENRRAFTFTSTGPAGAAGADPQPRHILYPIEWILGRYAEGVQ